MDNELTEELVETLKKEYKYHQKLKKLAKKKKDALIDNNVDELSSLLEKDNEVITDLEEMEDKRNDIINSLVQLYEIDPEKVNYSQLIDYFPENWRGKISSIREDLLNVIEELHELNEENRVLLEEAIKLNNFSFNMMSKILEPKNNTYGKNKNRKTGNVKHLIDKRG